MKKGIIPISILCFTVFAKAQPIKLQDGTQVDIITTQAISSKSAKEGEQIIFQMAEDVMVDGKIVIKANSIVKGEVTEVEKAKMLGKAGKLEFSLDYAKAVDGQNIRLRATKALEGKGNEGGAIAGAIFFAPLALIKGKEVTIEKGKRFTVYVDRDYAITPQVSQIASQATTDSLSNKSQTTAPAISLADELKKLKDLYDSGVLTKDEFEKAKKKLLEKNN